MNRISLVTGASGFIGSHLVELLVKHGHKVRVLIRYSSDLELGKLNYLSPAILSQIEIVRGDIKEYNICTEIVKDCDYIFHLAAMISITYSYQNPNEFIQTNVLGTSNLLNAALNVKGLKRFSYISSSGVYGSSKYLPIDEQHSIAPISPYAVSKTSADLLTMAYANTFDLPVTVIRLFNTYGPRQSNIAVIPSIIEQCIHDRKVSLGNLFPKRDFLYVQDAVDGIYNATTNIAGTNQLFNLGTGKMTSIKNLLELIVSYFETEIAFNSSNKEKQRSVDQDEIVANIEKLEKTINWSPRYTLEEGIEKTIDWYQNEKV
jgi:dTDP-glucose 4,6-dehydratase